MNINLMKQLAKIPGYEGLNKMIQAVEMGGCPFCGNIVTTDEFATWNALYKREFNISGTCKPCQDKTFGSPE